MTRLARTLIQTTRMWSDDKPRESAFFKQAIEEAVQKWASIEAANEEPIAVNFAATAKEKEEGK